MARTLLVFYVVFISLGTIQSCDLENHFCGSIELGNKSVPTLPHESEGGECLCCLPMHCPEGKRYIPCSRHDPTSGRCDWCEHGLYLPFVTISTDGVRCFRKPTCQDKKSMILTKDGGPTRQDECLCDTGKGHYNPDFDESKPLATPSHCGTKWCPSHTHLVQSGECVMNAPLTVDTTTHAYDPLVETNLPGNSSSQSRDPEEVTTETISATSIVDAPVALLTTDPDPEYSVPEAGSKVFPTVQTEIPTQITRHKESSPSISAPIENRGIPSETTSNKKSSALTTLETVLIVVLCLIVMFLVLVLGVVVFNVWQRRGNEGASFNSFCCGRTVFNYFRSNDNIQIAARGDNHLTLEEKPSLSSSSSYSVVYQDESELSDEVP